MEKWHVVVLLVSGVLLLLLSVWLRATYGTKVELKTIDLVLIILPLVLALLVTGKLKVLDAFGFKADLTDLFSSAAGKSIEAQVDSKSSPDVDELVNMLEMAPKVGVRDIPRLVQNKTEALVFRLGHGGYYGPAIEQYFRALYASSYLQYLVVTNPDKTLFGVYNVLDLAVHFRTAGDSGRAYDQFARWLNDAGDTAREQLAALPGFVSVEKAIGPDMSKRDALRQMDSLRVDSLPVVNARGVFVGTVERSQLTASLILDVVGKLERREAPDG